MKWLLILLIPLGAFAQNSDARNNDVIWNKKVFSIAYFGNNIWNPGAQFTMEVPWRFKNKSRIIKRKSGEVYRESYKQINFNGDVGFYVDPTTHVAVFSSFGMQFRRILFDNIALNCKINPVGYYRSFLKDTYTIINGQVEKVFLPGRNYYAPSMSFGIGNYIFDDQIRGWFINLHIMIQAPYNAFVNPLLSLNVGYSISKKTKKKL